MLASLVSSVRSGRLSRRSFLAAAAALGVGAAAAEEALEAVRVPLIASFMPAEPKVLMTVVNVGEESAEFFADVWSRYAGTDAFGNYAGDRYTSVGLHQRESALAPRAAREVVLALQRDFVIGSERVSARGFQPGGGVFVLRDVKVRPARAGMGTWRRA